MGLRLRYEVDTPQRLGEHLHVADGAAYFFFPGASAGKGTPVALEICFTATDQTALLRGQVWVRPATGGIWLELPRGARFLARIDDLARADARLATDQLVLAEGAGQPGLLCRLRDVSEGGARIAATASDLGGAGGRVRVALPEAGPAGGQLEAFGQLVWAGGGEAGLEWCRADLSSRAAARRLLEVAGQEWETARTVSHSPNCRCMRAARRLVLLG